MTIEETMREIYARINEQDMAGMGALMADDFVEHEELPDGDATKQGVLKFFEENFAVFPDFRMDVQDLIISGDKAVARVDMTGTQQAEFMGVPATGRRVKVQVIDIMRIGSDGKMAEHWGLMDGMSLMQQLGALPA